MKIKVITKKMTIAMHCSWMPPDITSVVLGFNYEDQNALA